MMLAIRDRTSACRLLLVSVDMGLQRNPIMEAKRHASGLLDWNLLR